MADIITHIYLSKEININNNSMLTFSIGPDAFYFSKYKRYGKIMHRKNVLLFFKNYISYIKSNNLVNNKEVLGSLYGFISHYILDKNIHPYVFYKSGVYNKKDRCTFKYKGGHRNYEMGITKYILEKNGIDSNNYKVDNDIIINNSKEIEDLLNDVFKITYNFDNAGTIYLKSINNVKKVYKYLRYDKFGIKKSLYKCSDILFRTNISNTSFYKINDIDLNLNNRLWLHPCNKEENNTSVLEIYNNSKIEIINIIDKINDVLFNNKDIDILDKIIGNYSYINGLDCNNKNVLRYFEY